MPEFADSSGVVLSFIPEATWNTTPATPAMQKVRFTSESLTNNIQNVVSDEVRPDPAVSDLVQTGADVSGDLAYELSFGGEFDSLFEAALRGSFSTNVLKAGSDSDSFTFERQVETGTPDHYFRYTGCRIGSLSMNVSPGSIISGSIGVVGAGHATDTAIIAGATYNDGNTNPIMAPSDVASITLANTTTTLYFTEMSLSLNNNLGAQNAVGSLAPVGVRYGRREITGNLTAYFEDKELYDLFMAGTESSLAFDTTDGTNFYRFSLPRIKYQTGQVVTQGVNQDMMAQMTFQALYDGTAFTDFQIDNI